MQDTEKWLPIHQELVMHLELTADAATVDNWKQGFERWLVDPTAPDPFAEVDDRESNWHYAT